LRALASPLIKRLGLAAAVKDEAQAQRSLVPPEPGWDRLEANSTKIEQYVANILKEEWIPAAEREVGARKAGHGIRPIAYWGPTERVVYRALTRLATKPFPALDRSPEAYLKFVKAPLEYAAALEDKKHPSDPLGFFLFDTPVEYVVKSDITSFYQYIDHSILADELLTHGAEFEAVQALVELLGEVQGRSYGLPQLLDASDALSEIYIDRVERSLLRAGLAVWRYNDDFRIACNSYSDTLAAVELLDRAARAAGLMISEGKTVTYGLGTYLINTFGLEITEPNQLIELNEVEAVIGDYTDNFHDDDGTAAAEFIRGARVGESSDGGVNLKEATTDQVRLLRRAFGALTAKNDAAVIGSLDDIAAYVPSLTPDLSRYMMAVHAIAPDVTAEAIDRLVAKLSMNDWQRLWFLQVARDIGALSTGTREIASRLRLWVTDCRLAARSEPVRAAATMTLAAAELLELDDALKDLDIGANALLPYYVRACALVATSAGTTEATKRLDAVARESTLHAALAEMGP
jgi:hypothetical protein